MDLKKRRFLSGRIGTSAVPPLRPPWALRPDIAFTASCTRCADCVTACPQRILKRGDGGFPQVDFQHAGCTLCGACVEACHPRALLRTVEPAFPSKLRIDDACLNRQGVECRVCGEACDARAIRFVPARGGIATLRLDRDICTGCGMCIAVCPVSAIAPDLA